MQKSIKKTMTVSNIKLSHYVILIEISNLTFSSFSIKLKTTSRVMKAPVLPIPALQWTKIGPSICNLRIKHIYWNK